MHPRPRPTRLLLLLLAALIGLGSGLGLLLWEPLVMTTAAQTIQEYRFPCTVTASGNWRVVRDRKRLTDQQLLNEINTAGRFGHGGTAAQIDFNNNTNNLGPRTYGICDNLTIRAARSGTFRSFKNEE